MNHSGRHPSKGLVIRTLKDGYWDRTEVIELPGGGRRVRKRTKGVAFGPWGVESLRREIRYLASLPERIAAVFPTVLAAWDDESGGAPDVGYEMPFYAAHLDAGELARGGTLAQEEIDGFQDALAEALFDRLYEPLAAQESLAGHVSSVVGQAWHALEEDPALALEMPLAGGRVHWGGRKTVLNLQPVLHYAPEQFALRLRHAANLPFTSTAHKGHSYRSRVSATVSGARPRRLDVA